jgi:C_GCAxxG_C_C family probable redox protein
MPIYDEIVAQVLGPTEVASYPDPTRVTPQEVRLRLLDRIAKSAFNNLRGYSNCCRSALWAVQVHLRLPGDGAFQAASTLAGGIVGTGETCGSVLGGLMAIGQALGPDSFRDPDADARVRVAAKTFVDTFTERIGSTRCYEVQEAVVGWCCDDPSKAKAWYDANGLAACAAVCGYAARLAAQLILDQSEPVT